MSAKHHAVVHAVVHRVRLVLAFIILISPNVIVTSSTATTVCVPTLFAVATHRHRRRRRSQPHHLGRTGALAAKKKKTTVNTNIPSGGKGFGRNAAISSPTKTDLVDDYTTTISADGASQQHNGQPPVDQADEVDDTTSTTSSPIHAHLVQWLSSHPNTHITYKFSIRPSSLGGGYGGFANNFIPQGGLILQIPRELCVTYDDVLHDPTCGHVFQSIKNERIPSWGMILIAGWITKEHVIAQECSLLAMDASNNCRIKHNPYLQSLPWTRGGSFSQDHILFWSQDEVETLLGGSKAYADAVLIRSTVDDAIKRLADVMVPIILHDSRVKNRSSRSDHRQLKGLPSTTSDDDDNNNADIRERYSNAVKGAFVIALSRSFAEEVESDDGTTIEVENVLLPLIDILQHSNTPNTMLESYDDYILLRARRDIEKGEELFHQYQEEREDVIPPHKFFTRYGFIPGVKEPIAELLKSKSDLFF